VVPRPLAPQAPAAERRRPARRWAALALVGAVVTAGIVWLVAGRQTGDQAQQTRSASFTSPVHLAPDTSLVRSRVLPSGDLLVTHWIRSSTAIRTVTLRTPHVAGLAPGTIRVGHIVLATDGVFWSAPKQPRGSGLVSYGIPPTRALYVRYQISGAVERSGPPGRALARITSVEVDTGSALAETTRTVVGARVLALACSPSPTAAAAVPCGSDDRGQWSVRLGRGDGASTVMAQLDLS
jgi:hypothetical protein